MKLPSDIENIEVHKYSIIAPILYGSEKRQNKYFRKLEREGVRIPPGSLNIYHFKMATLKTWLRNYRENGLEGLKQKARKDKGKFKKITKEVIDSIQKIEKEYPPVSVADLYLKLILNGYIEKTDFSYEALRIYVNKKGLFKNKPKKDRKKFEKEFPNELWMVDFKHGKTVKYKNGYRKTYLCAIIDDCCRVLVGYEWGYHEDTALFARVFKKAISIYGLPDVLYCDNGGPYKSHYNIALCGKLGLSLCFTETNDPEAKAKIERFNRTIAQMFYPLVKDFKKITLEQLNHEFSKFIDTIYHVRKHGSLGEPPLIKFQRLLPKIKINRINDQLLDDYFLDSFKRKVRLDGTVRINNKFYEVDMKYVGQYVELQFNLDKPNQYFLDKQPIKEVNLIENANRPHINTSYSRLLNKKKGEK